MATRTSHSSPCFLRVAEASAASRASKMTSLSTPFSLETASTTIRISLFTLSILTGLKAPSFRPCGRASCPSNRQSRLGNLGERNLDFLPVHLELDPLCAHELQQSGKAPPPGPRLLQLHKHPRAHEALEVRRRAQDPVESGRGHLQCVSGRNRVLHIEQGSDLAAHALAIVYPHPLRPIDEQAHERLRTPRCLLELDQLITQLSEQRLNEGDEPLPQGDRHRKYPPPRIKMGLPRAHHTDSKNAKSPSGGFLNKRFVR